MTDRDLHLRMYRTMAVLRRVADPGYEAVSVGTAAALRPDDLLCPRYRDPGAHLWRRTDPANVHCGRFPLDIYEPPGHLDDSYPVATGSAFAFKYRGEDRVALSYGTPGRGDFAEALDIAAVLDLPCVFVVTRDAPPGTGVPVESADGTDVLAVYRATSRAVDRARAGGGPSLVAAAVTAGRDPVGEFATKLVGLGYASAEELNRMTEGARVHAG